MTDTNVLIVGGGQAGMVAGFLFARTWREDTGAGKARRFPARHRPSTLTLFDELGFDELGLLDGLLARPQALILKAVRKVKQIRKADVAIEDRFVPLGILCESAVWLQP